MVKDMVKFSKVAISLPSENLKRIEKIRKELGLQRSALIDRAVCYWLENMEKQKMIKQYEDGYRNHPESAEEIKIIEAMSADGFKEEGLK